MSDSMLDTKLHIANLAWKPLRSRTNAIYGEQFKKTNSHLWSCDNHSFMKDRWMGTNTLSYKWPLPEDLQEEARKIILACIDLDREVKKVTQQLTPLLMLLTENRVFRLPFNLLVNLDLESVKAMLSPQQPEDRIIYAMEQYKLAKPKLQKYIAYQLLG